VGFCERQTLDQELKISDDGSLAGGIFALAFGLRQRQSLPRMCLTLAAHPKTLRAVIRPGLLRSSAYAPTVLCLGLLSFILLGIARAAVPFTSATVTKVENKVNYGEKRGSHSTLRPAAVMDTIKGSTFLMSETESRAELQYPDGTVVRIGQNTIFSFDSDTRTLSLENGSLLFHIPKGAGGGTIKTPTLTAAITGTAGKVSNNIIAIVEGVIKLIPSGKLVHAGEFARMNPDGSITIAKFNPDSVLDGKLVYFNGLMPGFEESFLVGKLTLPDLHFMQIMEETQNLPSSIRFFFPPSQPSPANRSNTKVFVPPPTQKPVPTPPPTRRPGRGNY